MRGPLVSIVMPAYDCSRTLGGAILGIVNQTYLDWELIVVDDGSTQDLSPEVEQFADRRIRLVRLNENMGLGHALNVGLEAARGRYVARMDADDFMEDWRIAEQIRFLMIEGLAFCGTDARKFGEESDVIRNPRSGARILDSFLTGNPFVHPTIMFDRSRITPNLQYDAEFRCEEDYDLWGRIVLAENCANMPGESVRFRIRAGSNSNHPTKRRFNRIALERFAQRLGIAEYLPVAALNEFHITRSVGEAEFRALANYARFAEKNGWPRVGMLHGGLLDIADYADFAKWLDASVCPTRHEPQAMGANPKPVGAGSSTAEVTPW